MKRSLRLRLLVLVLAATAAVWIGTVVMSWIDARHEVDELLDAHLAQAAALLIAQTSQDIDEIDLEHAPLLHRHARKVAFQVWEHGERLRLHSLNAPAKPLGTADAGFSDREMDGTHWRVFTAWSDDGRFLVHVGEHLAARKEIAGSMARSLLAPLVVALPLLAILIWLAIRVGLRPLTGLAREVSTRTSTNLDPVMAPDLPLEVRPLVDQLNGLLNRIEQGLARERRFTADAAHELRTPIAAIKAQAQVARSAAGDDERTRALDNVIRGTDRAARLVEQLLTLARLEAGSRGRFEPCLLLDVAREAVAELVPAMLERGTTVEVDGDATALVHAMRALLQVLVRNLVDNAARHVPVAGRVRVSVERTGNAIDLQVVDNGPGIPANERARVFERFHRLPGAGEGGSGLGLSIVRHIAELHDATVTLEDAPGGHGLCVRVRFPRSTGPAHGDRDAG